MAIKIYEKFAPRANPADGDYPYGSIKNESVPGAKDGTPLDAVWANDYAGFDADLFAQTGTVPSGVPDKLGASQRVEAIKQLKKASDKITFKMNSVTSLLRNQDDINRDSVSVKNWVSVTDGVVDNTSGFQAGVNYCYITGRKLYVPNPDVAYLITSTIQLTQFVTIEGESAALQDNYFGLKPAGTLIKYTGTGACFEVVASAPNPATRRAYGCSFKKLVIKGTAAGSYGIKVGDLSNVNNIDKSLSGINIEDIFCLEFFHGTGLGMFWTFGNNIKNYEVQNCGIGMRLNTAHRTTITAGSLEQCLVGLDCVTSYDVTLHGTGMQGILPLRIPIFGMQVPSDFLIWDGWDGTGFHGITRTVPNDYAGVGVRNIGSIISWYGGYEEENEVGFACEVGSVTKLYGKFTDFTTNCKYFAQMGAGAFLCNGNTFFYASSPNLVSIFAEERSGAVFPVDISGCDYQSTIPESKKFTGYKTSAGFEDSFDKNTYRGKRTSRDFDHEIVRGSLSAEGYKQTGGFNKYSQETILPVSTGAVTVDLGSGTTGTSFRHVTDSANADFNFTSGGSRLTTGVEMLLHVINIGATQTTVTFSGTHFKVGSASYSIGSNKQRIFKFIFSNGYFIEQGVEVSL